MNNLCNARLPGEDFKAYRARRRLVQQALKHVLRGKLAYESTRPTIKLPVAGADPTVDAHVLAGRIRDVTLITEKGGAQFRIGRSKGVSRLHPSKKLNPGMKRAERRAMYKRNEWRAAA